ncbi:uroporphyrinogen decarboxylase family protein [Chloroflexota bacterium]|nr:uroporphyrinogen decarboxylase family protein [Chloroflexota bacterium]
MKISEMFRGSSRRLVAPLMGYPGAILTNSSLRQNGFNAELHYRSISALVNKFHPDIIFSMMDLSVEAGALGLQIRYPHNESPSIEFHPVRQISDLEHYRVLDPLWDARLRSYIKTMSMMSQNITSCVRGGYVTGPFTLAGLLIGASEIAIATIENPELVYATLELAEEVITRYALELVQAGAEVIAILEPTATFLSPSSFKDFSGVFIDRIAKQLDRDTILHICGNTTRLIPAMCETEVQGLSLDTPVNMLQAIKQMPTDMALIGNIDPVRVMVNGNPEDVKKAVCDLCTELADYPNFILSTGCDIPLETPLENIAAFMEAGRAS